MEFSINKNIIDINEIKKSLEFINNKKRPEKEKADLNNFIISKIKENPNILTEKIKYLFTNILFADYLIEKGNEDIVKTIIDTKPYLLNRSYCDFANNLYEGNTASPFSEYQKYITAHIIAMKNKNFIPYMLEKNKDVVENRDFLRYVIEFGSDDVRKYLIDNFLDLICKRDNLLEETFAHQIVKYANSDEIITHLENTVKDRHPEIIEEKDRYFRPLEGYIKNFLRNKIKY